MTKEPMAFISYRSADSKEFFDKLRSFLIHDLGIKVPYIRPGRRWRPELLNKVTEADVFIALIGDKWAKPAWRDSTHDINNPDDVVRKEVEEGLRKKDRCLFVGLDGYKLKDRKGKQIKLPQTLSGLRRRQWVSIGSDFESVKGLGELTVELHRVLPKPIVLLSSTLAFLGDRVTTDGLAYFVTLTATLVQDIMSRNEEVILKVPPWGNRDSATTAAQFQRRLLEEIIDNHERYSGLIIAPCETKILLDDLHELWKSNKDFPIATIDKKFDLHKSFFRKHKMPAPPGVACDGFHNAQLAANSVIRYLSLMRINHPNVVILQGQEGSDSRIRGFIHRVKDHNAKAREDRKVHVSVSKDMDFLKDPASKSAHAYLTTNDWGVLNDHKYMKMTKEPRKLRRGVDAFFCCNDEIAIGACETLERALKADKPVLYKTVVVGFDGIPEATRRINSKDLWLLDTVDVKVHNQVDDLIELFIPAVRGR
jgi:DNA-binding LacI/PurR family transcriptional regulator